MEVRQRRRERDNPPRNTGQNEKGVIRAPSLERERKKAEKLAKFNEKKAKQQAAPAAAASSTKAKEKPKKTVTVDAYEPQKIEADRYEWWESKGLFKPQFTKDGKIKYSSYLILTAHIWHCMSKARGLPDDQITKLFITVDGRTRLDPPVPQNYFGNTMFLATPIALSFPYTNAIVMG